MVRIACALIGALAFACGSALAQTTPAGGQDGGEVKVKAGKATPKSKEKPVEVTIKDFVGHFVGRGVTRSQGSRQFSLASRELDVKIELAGEGFRLTWKTVRRRALPSSKKRSVTQVVEFVPTGQKNVWKAKKSGELLKGEPVTWARLRGPRLSVYVIQMNPATGGYASAVYTRELIESGMQLRFRRVTEGNPVRTVVAYLERVTEGSEGKKQE